MFGIPLSAIAQRTGQPLPQCILQAMKFLREQAPEALGVFRKSGVRSRIAKLKVQCDSSTGMCISLAYCRKSGAGRFCKYYNNVQRAYALNRMAAFSFNFYRIDSI